MYWRFREKDDGKAAFLARELGQPLKVGEFLAARGFSDPEEVKAFIRADLKSLPSPLSLTDLAPAAERLARALRTDELLAVCGDYDADGLTGAALLTRGLRRMGHRVLTYIPHRLKEGYGLKPEAVLELAARGAKVLVTVDNGISALEAVQAAKEAGLEVIITDHHSLPSNLPEALAVVNPHRDAVWRASPPAGVGVAFMLLCALKKSYQRWGLLGPEEGPSLMENLALVAIGTIADLAPLAGVNRILVRHGLKFLAASRQPGLLALKKLCGLENQKTIHPRDVAFRLAPRLNAAGRLGSAEPALNLLLAEEEEAAEPLARQLEELNRERHNGQNRLCSEALERLEEEISPDSRTVVLSGEGWPRGLLGLGASRLADSTGKPAILFSLENGLAVGSGRSAGNFDLFAALNQLRPLFISFGGHAQAAGLTLARENLDAFRKAFEELAQALPLEAEQELWVDFQGTLNDLEALTQPLSALAPFGQDHPSPVAALMRVEVLDARPTETGGEHHLKLVLGQGLSRQTVVGFHLASRLCEVRPQLDVTLSLDFSEYKGRTAANWQLVDFRIPQ